MNEMLEKKREVKNSKRAQSIPRKRNNRQTMSIIETPKHINYDDGEINACDTETQEYRSQYNPFRRAIRSKRTKNPNSINFHPKSRLRRYCNHE